MGAGYDMWQLLAPEGDGGGLDAATRQRLAAQAAALRRQEQLGTVAALTGDRVLAPYGQQLISTAREQAAQLGEAPAQRLRMALERQRLATGEDEAAQRALQADPASAASGTARALLAKFMPKQRVAANASAKELLSVLPLAEKSYQVDENSRNRAAALAFKRQADSGASDALSPEALDMLAEQFATTGKLPALGMGKSAAELRMRIATRATQLHPGVDLAGAAAAYGSDSNALKKLQEQADRIDAFEKTAIANLDTAVATARKVVDVGSPWFNKPLRAVQQGLGGSADMQRYITARQVAVQEVAKVLSGAMGNAAVSDSARHEVEALLSPDASMEQIVAAAEVLRQDMANRKVAMDEQLREIRYRTSGRRTGPEPAASGASAPPATTTTAPPTTAGLSPEKRRRLEELRAKRAAGTIQ